jgi:hypothetical protein
MVEMRMKRPELAPGSLKDLERLVVLFVVSALYIEINRKFRYLILHMLVVWVVIMHSKKPDLIVRFFVLYMPFSVML